MARLAQSFNRSAARIEELVNAHRLLLAHASHEIRTPLSRIRLGIEMLSQNPDPKYKAGLEQDIAELDALVDDILLASRLDMNKTLAAARARSTCWRSRRKKARATTIARSKAKRSPPPPIRGCCVI